MALGQLRERHRLTGLFQIEMALRQVAQARFERVLGHLPRKSPRLPPDALFDVGAVDLVADVIGHVAVFTLAFVDTVSFGHTHHFHWVLTGAEFLLGISPGTNPLDHTLHF